MLTQCQCSVCTVRLWERAVPYVRDPWATWPCQGSSAPSDCILRLKTDSLSSPPSRIPTSFWEHSVLYWGCQKQREPWVWMCIPTEMWTVTPPIDIQDQLKSILMRDARRSHSPELSALTGKRFRYPQQRNTASVTGDGPVCPSRLPAATEMWTDWRHMPRSAWALPQRP